MTTITQDVAEEFLYAKEGEEIEGYQKITVQFVEKLRWYDLNYVILRDKDDVLWGYYYFEPATEMQEGQDLFEGNPVPLFYVGAKQTTEYFKAEHKLVVPRD